MQIMKKILKTVRAIKRPKRKPAASVAAETVVDMQTSELMIARPENAQQAIHTATLILNSATLSPKKRQERLQGLLKEQRFSLAGYLAADKRTINDVHGKEVGTIQPGDLIWTRVSQAHVESVWLGEPAAEPAASPAGGKETNGENS
jgi:hypothetical protein